MFLFSFGLILLVELSTVVADDHPTSLAVYPEGDRFPLALYSIHTVDEMTEVRRFGWNVGHTYHFKESFLKTCQSGGLLAMAHLRGGDADSSEAAIEARVRKLAKNDQIAWWELPEEQRFWRKKEFAWVVDYSRATRKFDPRRRPNYMYIPGHYDAGAVKHYVKHLDVVPASVYPMYASMPHAWVRWRMEATVNGIKLADAKIGKNYLKGEKTPVAVIELFDSKPKSKTTAHLPTPPGTYHNIWQTIVSGAQGIVVYSFFHQRDRPQLVENWKMCCKAAKQLTGAEGLGQMILYGKDVATVGSEIASGPKKTAEFTPYGTKLGPMKYSSLDLMAKQWKDQLYVVVVNSAEENVSAKITGLPKNATEAEILFKDRSVAITNGALNLNFAPLEVRLVRVKPVVDNKKK